MEYFDIPFNVQKVSTIKFSLKKLNDTTSLYPIDIEGI